MKVDREYIRINIRNSICLWDYTAEDLDSPVDMVMETIEPLLEAATHFKSINDTIEDVILILESGKPNANKHAINKLKELLK